MAESDCSGVINVEKGSLALAGPGGGCMRILQVGTTRRSGKRPRLLGVYGLLLVAVAVLAVAGMGGGAAFAADTQHGIAVTKGCVSPTQIGKPYTCTYSVRN